MDDSSVLEIVEWFRSLPNPQKREKLQSLRDFYNQNTRQLIRAVKNLESIKSCPKELISDAKKLISNNLEIVSSLEKIEFEVQNAEKKSDNQANENPESLKSK